MYNGFAKLYDIFMEDIPYKKWASYIEKTLCSHNVPQDALLLDLACGTGTMSFLMAQKGYDMIGVDVSEDMLSEAYEKMYQQNKRVLFLNQNILNLDLYGTVDAAYCTCDALNYLLTEEEFIKALSNVALFLNPKGIFIFDLKTDNKYRKMGNGTYNDIVDGASYIWKNHYDTDTYINEYHIQFFTKSNTDTNKSFEEVHRQRSYSICEVQAFVKEAGFEMVSVQDNYTDNPANEESERVTYVISKPC